MAPEIALLAGFAGFRLALSSLTPFLRFSQLYHKLCKYSNRVPFILLETLAFCYWQQKHSAFMKYNTSRNALTVALFTTIVLNFAGLCSEFLGIYKRGWILQLFYVFSPLRRNVLKTTSGKVPKQSLATQLLAIWMVFIFPAIEVAYIFFEVQNLSSSNKYQYVALGCTFVALVLAFFGAGGNKGSNSKDEERKSYIQKGVSTESASRKLNVANRSKDSALRQNLSTKGENSYYFAHKSTVEERIVYDGTPTKLN